MNLERISHGMRLASDLARAGERLLDSLAASRRLTAWPVLLGMGVGVGIGALLFSEEARAKAKAWLSDASATRLNATAVAEPKPQAAARPS